MIRAHMKGSRRTAPFLPSRRTTMLMDYPSRQSSLLPFPRASHPVLLVCVYYYSHQRACTVSRHCPCQLSFDGARAWWKLRRKYEVLGKSVMEKLNQRRATFAPKASKGPEEMINRFEALLENKSFSLRQTNGQMIGNYG